MDHEYLNIQNQAPQQNVPVQMASGDSYDVPFCTMCSGTGSVLENGKKVRCSNCKGSGTI